MFTKIFAVIELFLALLRAKDDFLDWYIERNSAEIEKRTQRRNAAIDASKKAETDDEIFKSQDDIISNLPKP